MNTIEYKVVDTSTLKGLKEAERLKNNGWDIIRTGLFIVWFEKINTKGRKVI